MDSIEQIIATESQKKHFIQMSRTCNIISVIVVLVKY